MRLSRRESVAMPFFHMPFCGNSPVYISRSPKGLRNDIKFRGSTFDPVNKIVLRNSRWRQVPGIPRDRRREKSLFCLGDPRSRKQRRRIFPRATHFREDGDSRRIAGRTQIKVADSRTAISRIDSPLLRGPDKNPRSHKYKVP